MDKKKGEKKEKEEDSRPGERGNVGGSEGNAFMSRYPRVLRGALSSSSAPRQSAAIRFDDSINSATMRASEKFDRFFGTAYSDVFVLLLKKTREPREEADFTQS